MPSVAGNTRRKLVRGPSDAGTPRSIKSDTTRRAPAGRHVNHFRGVAARQLNTVENGFENRACVL